MCYNSQMAPEYEFINSENKKIYSLRGVIEQLNKYEANLWDTGLIPSAGLVTGAFDILHPSHLDFLESAKSEVDTLIIGVDRDETVALKGIGKPYLGLKARCELLAGLECVDFVFPIPFILKSYESTQENADLFEEMTRNLFYSTKLGFISNYYLITNEETDEFRREKWARAKKLNIIYRGLQIERKNSSSAIVKKILSN